MSALIPVDAVVDDTSPLETLYHVQLKGHEALLRRTPDVLVDVRKFGGKWDGRNNNDAMYRAQTEVLNQGGGTLYMPAGDTILGDFLLEPKVNLVGPGKAQCRINTMAGALRACLIWQAKNPGSGTPSNPTYSYRPLIHGFLINGNRGNQVNIVDGILFENANLDPQFGTVWQTDDYSSGYFDDVEIIYCTGIGFNSAAGRHRMWMVACKATNCNFNGVKVGGDDSIIGPRTGFGANGMASVFASGMSGFMLRGANVWTPAHNKRTDLDQAVLISGCNGASIVGNVLNDSIRVRASTKLDDRAVVIVGNDMRPDSSTLVAQGTPDGTFTDYSNAWIIVDNSEQVIVGVNGYSTQGSSRWGFKYLITANNTGHAYFHGAASSDPNNCPWSDPTLKTPWKADGTSTVDVDFTDTFTNTHRSNSFQQLNMDDTETDPGGFGFILGNGLPSGNSLPVLLKPDLFLSRGEAWDWGSSNMAQRNFCNAATANNFSLSYKRRYYEFYSSPIVTQAIATLGIQLGAVTGAQTLPTPGKIYRLRFANPVTALTITAFDFTSGVAPPVFREPPPTSVAAGTVLEYSLDQSGVGGVVNAWNRIL